MSLRMAGVTVALVTTAAAVLAPALQAVTSSDANQPSGVPAAVSDAHDRGAPALVVARWVATDAHDRAAFSTPSPVGNAGDPFDWRDASIGAAGGLALALLLAALVVIVGRRRSLVRPAV